MKLNHAYSICLTNYKSILRLYTSNEKQFAKHTYILIYTETKSSTKLVGRSILLYNYTCMYECLGHILDKYCYNCKWIFTDRAEQFLS